MERFAKYLLSALLMLPATSLANEYIYSFDGQARAYKITRGDEELGAAVFLPLREGDEVSVLTDWATLTIRSPGADDVVVSRQNSPYRIEAPVNSPAGFDNLLYWATTVLNDFTGKENISRVNLVTRSVPRGDAVIALPPVDSLVTPGTSSLTFVVKGVRIDVRLKDREGTDIPLEQSRGGLLIATIDSDSRYPLSLVSGDTVRRIELTEQGAPRCPHAEAKLMAEACLLWLAGQQEGRWQLSAISQLNQSDSPQSAYLVRVMASVVTRKD
jgi:hypothetical protein